MECQNDPTDPSFWSRARRRVSDWLQENARYMLASFAGAEAFLGPGELQGQEQEREVAAFAQWLGQVSAQDFANRG